MKILFWFNGSGGQRRERKVVDFPEIPSVEDANGDFRGLIEDELEEWKDLLHSNSEFQRWGWDENFDEKTLEPLNK